VARLDQLQHLGAYTSGTPLAAKGFENGAAGGAQVARGGSLTSLGKQLRRLIEEGLPLAMVHRARSRAMRHRCGGSVGQGGNRHGLDGQRSIVDSQAMDSHEINMAAIQCESDGSLSEFRPF
jgi:hypothetical protein